MKELPQVPLPGEERLVLNHTYEIKDVEPFTSELRGFEGIRVTLGNGSESDWTLALWTGRSVVGRKSKLGAFIEALGRDTNKWIGKRIQFRRWDRGDRVIAKVE